ncbi:MAG: ATP-binding protein [Saprospiraceae bacterium]|nr:ATP-binding protein [Saprospiraceae bacterium]
MDSDYQGLDEMDEVVARVIGTQDSTPMKFWVAVDPAYYLQLDDVVAVERLLPDGTLVKLYGIVTDVKAKHEGARFDSDVFLIMDGILPAEVSQTAEITTTRFEPGIFVPPLPGEAVFKARDKVRDIALYFDKMELKLPIGLTRDKEGLFLNLEFLNGSRGAHVNISGISGVATKTSYATFLLYSLFNCGILGKEAINTHVLIFNVKDEDLLFLDKKNVKLTDDQRADYHRMALEPGPFRSVEFWAPPRRGDLNAAPDVTSRYEGVTSFFWTIAEFCKQDLLAFLFADAEDDRQMYTVVIYNVMSKLREAPTTEEGGIRIDLQTIRTFQELVDAIVERLQDEITMRDWAGAAINQGTINAFIRRLYASVPHVSNLIRGDIPNASKHQINWQKQVTVIDIHNLNDRAKRFVVGVTLRRVFNEKERTGSAKPLHFVVLDELNKYAPREGSSPIKEILVDISERGRSLGIILIGAQQTASEIERRIVSNSSIRIVGRLDAAEAGRSEYGFLPSSIRQRATILKPGTMILAQPELPMPLVLEFPFPSWATRASEAAAGSVGDIGLEDEDPFFGIDN